MSDASEVGRRVQGAIEAGEVLSICYQGGSRPGTYREITPLAIIGQRVRARCHASGIVKTFELARIELRAAPPAAGDGIAAWTAPVAPTSTLATIAEVEAVHRAALEALGWHVAVTRSEDGEYLRLHRKTKAGKPLKSCAHSLAFQPMTWDTSHTREGEAVRTNVRPRVRPWSAAGKTWGDASKAIGLFLEAAAGGPPQTASSPK